MEPVSPKVAFRTDANVNIGTGHVRESVTIAQQLKNRYSIETLFIVQDDPVALNIVSDAGFVIEAIPVTIDPKADVEPTVRILKKYNIPLVVTNLRKIDIDYLKGLKNVGVKVICIDELGNVPIDCHAIINGSIVKEWHKYELLSDDIECYFGPEYMVMKENFGVLHDVDRQLWKVGTKILVSMGGADPSGATIRIINALKRLGKEFQKTIVIGPAFVHREELDALLPTLEGKNFEILHNVSNMEELMFDADVMLSAGGNTLYESACVGTPCIVLYEDEHERIQSEAFQERGAVINLGSGTEVPEEQIAATAKQLLNDFSTRKQMSQKGKESVDGRGAERICEIILKKLRYFSEINLRFLFHRFFPPRRTRSRHGEPRRISPCNSVLPP